MVECQNDHGNWVEATKMPIEIKENVSTEKLMWKSMPSIWRRKKKMVKLDSSSAQNHLKFVKFWIENLFHSNLATESFDQKSFKIMKCFCSKENFRLSDLPNKRDFATTVAAVAAAATDTRNANKLSLWLLMIGVTCFFILCLCLSAEIKYSDATIVFSCITTRYSIACTRPNRIARLYRPVIRVRCYLSCFSSCGRGMHTIILCVRLLTRARTHTHTHSRATCNNVLDTCCVNK